jgi:hypothetical protein
MLQIAYIFSMGIHALVLGGLNELGSAHRLVQRSAMPRFLRGLRSGRRLQARAVLFLRGVHHGDGDLAMIRTFKIILIWVPVMVFDIIYYSMDYLDDFRDAIVEWAFR